MEATTIPGRKVLLDLPPKAVVVGTPEQAPSEASDAVRQQPRFGTAGLGLPAAARIEFRPPARRQHGSDDGNHVVPST